VVFSTRTGALFGLSLALAFSVATPAARPADRTERHEAEAIAATDISGVYFGPDGRRWAVEAIPEDSVVMYALDRWYCVAPGTLISSGTWDGSGFAVVTPLYDVSFDDPNRCSVAPEGSLDRIVPVDDRSIDYCAEVGGCLRLVRRMRYVVELSAWIPHPAIADPYLPSPVAGLPDVLIDLAPPAVAPCLASDLVESVVFGQDHVGLVEPLLVVVTAEVVVTERRDVVLAGSSVAPMSLARTVAGFTGTSAPVTCVQEVTQSGGAIGTVTAVGNSVVLQLHAGLGIVPARREDVFLGETVALARLGCVRALSCDPREVALGTGRIDASVVLTLDADNRLNVQAATDAFPSFGLRISANGRVRMDTVLQDSSCYEARGPGGVFNIVELLHTMEDRGDARLADWPDDSCTPAALTGDALPSEVFGTDPSPLARFLLGVRYAASTP
jgi:hypothetical protein